MSVPLDWRHAELVPVPKKGDLSKCDNWRGIALLDVAGKLCGRIIQDPLQLLAERELPESQCGFRSGRGCPDAIFSVRQIIEKSYEHGALRFFAYLSICEKLMTLSLAKHCGVLYKCCVFLPALFPFCTRSTRTWGLVYVSLAAKQRPLMCVMG